MINDDIDNNSKYMSGETGRNMNDGINSNNIKLTNHPA